MKYAHEKAEEEKDPSVSFVHNVLMWASFVITVFNIIQFFTLKNNAYIGKNGDIVDRFVGLGVLPNLTNVFGFTEGLVVFSIVTLFFVILWARLFLIQCNEVILRPLPYLGVFTAGLLCILALLSPFNSGKIDAVFAENGIDEQNLEYRVVKTSDILVLESSVDKNLEQELDKDKFYYLYQVKDDGKLSLYYSSLELENIDDIKFISQIDKDRESLVEAYFDSLDG